ncbi:MAG: 3-dehydroquinate synthase, partial [Muribaculum sp.]|nr:3-dehydroquinate synthase [Muribaculum sp.]
MQKLIFTNEVARELSGLIEAANPHGVYVLADSNTERLVWPALVAACPSLGTAGLITIPAGDINKSLDSLSHIWSELQRMGANRHSLMINVGGGMITDIGGFAASTFKRGMRFVNVPTTLLGAVDASVGGKTGINFGGLKNEIGAFREAEAVVISTAMFSSLPDSEMYSGYAEMIKHGLLESEGALMALLAY